ncbi:MAG TPA: CDP-diacylglycerol--glycerol-3-phosphate 3-phosphatidyltransferase [Ruminococcaceae bacterium]|mgnify:FL=1|nr:CDP-diacylglycerol--glycerol-3-phosphate 3-phosphatidyltransferase [Oscillospiraceae bacterium]
MNLPNKITLGRMFIAPIFLAIYLAGIEHKFLVSAIIFALGAITDALDGRIARKNHIVTNFGKLLDPIADKMLVTAGLLAFMKDGLCSIWIVMVILTRDFAITSLRMIAAAQNVVIPANIGGKIKTVLQMVSFIAVMLMCEISAAFSLDFNMNLISNIMLGITAIVSVISGIVYIADGWKIINFKE